MVAAVAVGKMTSSEIMAMQKAIGVTQDGWWGPKSIEACKKHLKKMMPSPHPWPAPDQSSMDRFYGPVGNVETVGVAVPFKMYLYDGPSTVKSITVHKKVASSLSRVLESIKSRYPTDEERAVAGINKFFGSYVVRPMRGGRAWSKHAWAVAIDFDANRNGLNTSWPTKAKMPLGVMECFAKEGWLNLGWTIGRDSMHFQATQ